MVHNDGRVAGRDRKKKLTGIERKGGSKTREGQRVLVDSLMPSMFWSEILMALITLARLDSPTDGGHPDLHYH